MKAIKPFLLIFVVIFGVAHPFLTRGASTVALRWVLMEDREKYHGSEVDNFIKCNLHLGANEIVQVPMLAPTSSPAEVGSFRGSLKEALAKLENEETQTLHLFLVSHGEMGHLFQGEHLGKCHPVPYKEIVAEISRALSALPSKRRQELKIELYVDACFAGSITPELETQIRSDPKAKPASFRAWLFAPPDKSAGSFTFEDMSQLSLLVEKLNLVNSKLTQPAQCPDLESAFCSFSAYDFNEIWSIEKGRFSPQVAPELLAQLLTDGDPYVRGQAAAALSKQGKEGLPYAERLLSIFLDPKEDLEVRKRAALALRSIIPEIKDKKLRLQIRESLEKLLARTSEGIDQKTYYETTMDAVLTLEPLRKDAAPSIPLLRKWVFDCAPTAWVLSKVDPQAFEFFKSLWDAKKSQPDSILNRWMGYLAHDDDRARNFIYENLRHPDLSVRSGAIGTLSDEELNIPVPIEILKKALEKEPHLELRKNLKELIEARSQPK